MDKLNNIKIVFLDIDGTLTNSKKRLTLKTKRAIKKAVNKGIIVVLTTGRNALYTMNMSKRACASKIIIFSNGSAVYDYGNNKLIYGELVLYKDLKKIYNFCKKEKIGVIFNTVDDVYVNKYVKEFSEKIKEIDDYKALKKLKVVQTTFRIDNKEDAKKCKEFVKELELKISYLSKGFSEEKFNSIDVNSVRVSKGKAVRFLLKYLNIKKEDSLCIGDYSNDINMFKECGYKVAMKNASSDIKDIADYITLSNDDNGVAYFINNYL